ncbi:6-phosphogluconate dehydrogenase (decarboxylating) [Tessaracoccus aquimaris]|uniref:6-phosphogluconate dehydrogenase (Decarboxylating) n=1 Tax=Tessaracoccus aquimaris TaxID=1332264 RepID=A0A1Q2CR53_9ACTN|nr:decarboxylating 6-phosphogluconate dehydrogenase [Tessaracoccus aquimaris]AQP48545.1 6-phosphogluconate dehydrogenase (decarboxylating) [Tessaracoccus aquimaris]
MRVGLIGLGKMGGNMRERLRRGGVEVVGLDRNKEISDAVDEADLVAKLDGPRVIWLMVPIQAVTPVIETLRPLLSPGDIVIDGGNSKWTHDAKHAAYLAEAGIEFLDAGTSGGVWGLENGYALMVGGPESVVATAMPVFEALKPEGEFGFVHAGSHGAGHFAKMVHNGIEYGLMQAYAEGWELLEASDIVTNVPEIFESWREGTVIRSWLLDLMVLALQDDPHLDEIEGYAEDSGEGRWTVNAAVDMGVPVPTIAASLFARFVSRQEDSPAMKMVAAMRNQFGGHAVQVSKD